ncbi:DUF6281 family protein [Streptomyces sp. ATCC 21386]|uniref:DUF6281 family protein n=1 Tax=Streptomyces sp. ATCC 21386 TaxID=2699428 RepID=UPI001BFF71B7|nr:DUF6281 family protein [Streptomyces sp. ATCC 21386]
MLSGTRVRIALAALAMAPLTVGCAALDTGGTSSALCVFAVDYDDRQYVEAGKVAYTLGAEVGTARDSVCEDQGGGEEDRVAAEDLAVYTAYAIKGVDTEDAIAVRESPGSEVRVLVNAVEDEGMTAAVERVFGKGEQGGEDSADDGASDSGDGDSAATVGKCALVVEYGNKDYIGRGDAKIELGAKAGSARAVPCWDTPGEVDPSADPEVFQAYEIKGLDPADAIAIDFSADEEPFFMVRMGDGLPPEVEALLAAEEG